MGQEDVLNEAGDKLDSQSSEGLQKNQGEDDVQADPSAENQADEGKSDNPEDGKADKPSDDTVPENYDFSAVQLPEGMEFDKDLTEEFAGIAKDMGLSQDKADKLMGMGVKLSSKLQENFEAAIKESQQNQIKAYKTMLNTDPEIGGANLQKVLTEANVAYDTFVSDEAASLLEQTGLNNHPAIVKVFREIGKQLKNDTIRGGKQNTHTRTAADWYPEMG